MAHYPRPRDLGRIRDKCSAQETLDPIQVTPWDGRDRQLRERQAWQNGRWRGRGASARSGPPAWAMAAATPASAQGLVAIAGDAAGESASAVQIIRRARNCWMSW